MRIRSQLALAFAALSVVPLAGVVIHGYLSSQRAVRRALEAESAELAHRLDERLTEVRNDLGRRFLRLGPLPADRLAAGPLARPLLEAFGEEADLVDFVEFVPDADEPGAPEHSARVTPAAGEPHRVAIVELETAPPAAPEPPGVAVASPPPALPAPVWSRPLVIEMKAILAEIDEAGGTLSPEEQEQVELGLEAAFGVSEVIVRQFGGAELAAEIESSLAELGRELEERGLEEERLVEEERARREESERAEGQERIATGYRDDLKLDLPPAFAIPVLEGEERVGSLRPSLRSDMVLRQVLDATGDREAGEIAFAYDAAGTVYAASEDDRERVGDWLGQLSPAGGDRHEIGDWVVATTAADPASGLVFGAARPVAEALADVRAAAARNFAGGLALIGLALLGIRPLSARMTRQLEAVTAAADRIADGDLDTRVSTRSDSELGQLANAFNRMAEDLLQQKERLLEEQEGRREQEVRERVLQSEVQRRGDELEEARRFQLSLLPRTLPDHPELEVGVAMRTATEVGGDYYDFDLHGDDDRTLTLVIGDATGHGARAGTLVTVTKSLFSAHSRTPDLAGFLADAARTIRRMELGRMFMALSIARFEGRRLTFSAAGMPPALWWRHRSREVVELSVEGMPLGSLAWTYTTSSVELEAGDAILFLSDGLPELRNADDEPFGYQRVESTFAATGDATPAESIAALLAAADLWRGEEPLHDDLTLLVVRARAS